ncbi:MAG: hypothetical protein PHD30_02040 [Paludibacter sp.]|nr:hypothetical protein [Paludibacter sp.]
MQYATAIKQSSTIVFEDEFTGNWQEKWFLDGENAQLINTPNGLEFYAGGYNKPIPGQQVPEYHATLWTKQVFDGDIRIEFNYTRLDTVNRFVNILYIFAEGSGILPYNKDISKWNELRNISAMQEYYNNMNVYHISYSAFNSNGDSITDYIRSRRYIPDGRGLEGTKLTPEYFNIGMFKTSVKHHITVLSKGDYLFMKVESPEKNGYYYFNKSPLAVINSGRIGLRIMNFRAALISGFKIYKLN